MAFSIVHGDCREVLPTYEKASVDCIITSPPYNMGKAYERKTTLESYVSEQREVIGLCIDVLRDGGHICWQVGNWVRDGAIVPLDALLFPIFHGAGLKLRNRIVWSYEHGLHNKNRFSGRHETVSWWTKGNEYTFNLDAVRVPSKQPTKRYFKGPRRGELSCNPLGKNPGDVWPITHVKHNHPEKTAHPCQFPEALVERLVRALTNPGDVVLDPFMGSGTTAVVAHRLGREALGIEKEAEYVRIAQHRLGLPMQRPLVA